MSFNSGVSANASRAAPVEGLGQALRACVVAALLAVVTTVVLGCNPAPQAKPAQLAGKWKSSRLATPLYLLANGEWEIRTDEERVLQYGVWHLEGSKMVWTVKLGGQVEHDVNTLLAVSPGHFELRERDGSVTRFDRIAGAR